MFLSREGEYLGYLNSKMPLFPQDFMREVEREKEKEKEKESKEMKTEFLTGISGSITLFFPFWIPKKARRSTSIVPLF